MGQQNCYMLLLGAVVYLEFFNKGGGAKVVTHIVVTRKVVARQGCSL